MSKTILLHDGIDLAYPYSWSFGSVKEDTALKRQLASVTQACGPLDNQE